MADRLAREEGLHVGHSSGANVFAAVKIAERAPARAGRRVRRRHRLRSRRPLLRAHEVGAALRLVTAVHECPCYARGLSRCATRRSTRGSCAGSSSRAACSSASTTRPARAYARDEESCGFLVGPAGDAARVDAAVPMVNRANKLHELDPETYPRTGRMYFDIDPMKFARAIEQGEARGAPVKVLYHSHLDVGAYFSDTDAAAAKMGGDEPRLRSRVPRDERARGAGGRPQALRLGSGRARVRRGELRVRRMRRTRRRLSAWLRHPGSRRLRELASRVEDAYRAAGGHVTVLAPRFLYEDETMLSRRRGGRSHPLYVRSDRWGAWSVISRRRSGRRERGHVQHRQRARDRIVRLSLRRSHPERRGSRRLEIVVACSNAACLLCATFCPSASAARSPSDGRSWPGPRDASPEKRAEAGEASAA